MESYLCLYVPKLLTKNSIMYQIVNILTLQNSLLGTIQILRNQEGWVDGVGQMIML